MKEFIVKHENKRYKVKANDYNEAISAISAIAVKDDAGNLETINALIEDERAAVDAYNVALKNLEGKIPADAVKVITAIRDDENRHIENLQAVVNGNITEKNFEDCVKDNVTDNQIRYIRERAKDIVVFTDALKKLQSGGKVTGYADIKDVTDEIITFANAIIDVCRAIR